MSTTPSGDAHPQVPRQEPRRRTNDFATVGVIFGVAGCVLYSVSFLGMLIGAFGIVFGGIGLTYATRHDVGMAKALSAMAFGLVGVVLNVFSRGIG